MARVLDEGTNRHVAFWDPEYTKVSQLSDPPLAVAKDLVKASSH